MSPFNLIAFKRTVADIATMAGCNTPSGRVASLGSASASVEPIAFENREYTELNTGSLDALRTVIEDIARSNAREVEDEAEVAPSTTAAQAMAELIEFLDMPAEHCVHDTMKAMAYFMSLEPDFVLQVLEPKATRPDLRLPMGMPCIVVDPRKDDSVVNAVLESEKIQAYFTLEQYSQQELLTRFGRFR
jgi:hypothetical protein